MARDVPARTPVITVSSEARADAPASTPAAPVNRVSPPRGSASRFDGRLLTGLTLWSIAFGVVEGAVVVYLRHLCYPDQPADGPLFPLRIVEPVILNVERAREAATLLMLLGIAFVAERRPLRRFAAFAFCFGVWDLAYYAMLHVALGWPASLLEWDVLFLLPVPWSGPVLAPVLVAAALVGGAALLLRRVDDAAPSPFRIRDWAVQIACAGLILWSFVWNAGPVERLQTPTVFPWWLFLPGLLGGLASFAWRFACRTVRT